MRNILHVGGRSAEAARYLVNGMVATGVHFSVLTFAIEVVHIPLAAIANFIAAVVGITVSFLGNRYFVFREHAEKILVQALSFLGLYLAIALLHASLLFILTDHLGIDFRIGFVAASVMQMTLSYLGNRKLVFSR
jgi:putative flippase GtrA